MDDATQKRLGLIIRDHLDGWQEAIAQMLDPLREAIRARLCGTKLYRRYADNFIDPVVSYYWDQACEGKLLAAWDPEYRTPIVFLTGSNLYGIAVKQYHAQAPRRKGCINMGDMILEGGLVGFGIDDHPEAAVDQVPPDTDGGTTTEPPTANWRRCLMGFTPLDGKDPTQVHLMGACQLFGRIRWDEGDAPVIRDALPVFLQGATADWERQLQDALAVRLAHLDERHAKAAEDVARLKNHGRRRDYHRAVQRMDRADRERCFRPLDGHALGPLMGMKVNTCEKAIGRYDKLKQGLFLEMRDLQLPEHLKEDGG